MECSRCWAQTRAVGGKAVVPLLGVFAMLLAGVHRLSCSASRSASWQNSVGGNMWGSSVAAAAAAAAAACRNATAMQPVFAVRLFRRTL